MRQSPEGLTALQQGRLEAARERVLGFRDQVVDEVLQAAGLEKYGRENYSFHLGRISAGHDDLTVYQLNEMGLMKDGRLIVPAVVVSVKDGGIEQVVKDDRLRLKFKFFDGDTVAVPFFILGYEENKEFEFLSNLWLKIGPSGKLSASTKRGDMVNFFPVSKNFDEPNLQCLGIAGERVFSVTLAEEERFLFNKAGWLKTEKELDPLIDFMSRRVDLEPEYLSVTEEQRFTAVFDVLKKNPPVIHDWLREQFGLIRDFSKRLSLEGDIRGVVVQFASLDSSGQVTVIRLHDIVLPKENSETAWIHLARPKAGNRTGTLKIIIYSGGGHDGKVERYGVEQKGYNTDNLLTTENLAAILAKIRVE